MESINTYVLEDLNSTIGEGNYQLPLFFDKPIKIGSNMKYKIEIQKKLIDEFYDIVIKIARKALSDNNQEIIRLLFSDYVAGMTINYHRNLPDFCWRKPVFFRTDQSTSGKIYELQPPGSGWGDIPLIANALNHNQYELTDIVNNFVDLYANNIIHVTQKDNPKVFHMLDAASEPASMRYLFAKTRRKLRYWGIDQDVSMGNVDYVTAHSAASLTTSNYFNHYMCLATEGKVMFGISPNLLFDQKVIYLLPFYRKTRDEFSDDIRSLFPFTSFIEKDGFGFYDKNNEFIELDNFGDRRKSERHYFMKYGGTDLNRNWGSREVYRLDTGSKKDSSERLLQIKPLVEKGEIWLIQEDVSDYNIDSLSDDFQSIIYDKGKKTPHIKISAYYGTEFALGVKIMVRKHYKVHGQLDTNVGIGI